MLIATATMKARVQNPVKLGLAAIVFVWCVLVLYVLISVRCGIMYPLGTSLLADLIYELLLFTDPYHPHGGKLDIPIGLVHAFGLYKSSGWAIRLLKKQPS